jgi:hypothetical protein
MLHDPSTHAAPDEAAHLSRELSAVADDAPTRAAGLGAEVFTLPGGYLDDSGALHTEAELSPLTGRDEEFLASVAPEVCTASVVTELLARCLKRLGAIRDVDAALVRRLLVGDRDYLLLKLRRSTFGARLDVVASCAAADCGQPMQVRISLDDITFESKPAAARYFTMRLSPEAAHVDAAGVAQREVEFRLPTGEDQEAVAHLFLEDETRAVNQVFARCVRRVGKTTDVDEALVEGLSPRARREIEDQIELRAPRAAVELEGVCPECGTPFTLPLHFASDFARELRKNLQDLERNVHFLAWHYHWSEQDILSMTTRKRRRYVELLREELGRLNPS